MKRERERGEGGGLKGSAHFALQILVVCTPTTAAAHTKISTNTPCIKESFVMPSHSDMVGLYYVTVRVSEKCVCNAPFSADHAMICRKGGYPTLRHNEVRNLVASALNEVCTDVSLEPRLQPLSGEALPSSANKEDEARLDVKARGFWNLNDGQDAFLTSGCFTLLRLPISVPV